MRNRKLLKYFAVFLAVIQIFIFSPLSMMVTKAEKEKTTITFHFDNPKNEDWALWVWPKDGEGKEFEFQEEDSFGQSVVVELEGLHSEVGFLIKGPNWEKDVDEDRFVKVEDGQAEVWIKSEDPKVYTKNPSESKSTYKKIDGKIHFTQMKKDDDKSWFVSYWTNERDESQAKLTRLKNDKDGLYADIDISGRKIKELNFKIQKRNDGEVKLTDFGERSIKKFDKKGKFEAWVNQGEELVYYDQKKASIPLKINSFKLDSYDTAKLEFNKKTDLKRLIKNGISLSPNNEIKSIKSADNNDKQTKDVIIKLKDKIELDDKLKIEINKYKNADDEGKLTSLSTLGRLVTDPKFDDLYYYDGELGAIYSQNSTEFKLWAPTAQRVDLIIFKGDKEEKVEMELGEKGVYSAKLDGNRLGTEFMYDVHVDNKINRVVDPYAKAVTINGERSVVANPQPSEITNPLPENIKSPVIYELHIRDLSISKDSGIKHKGKFKALTEEGTRTDSGQITGLDYIKSLGVTHVQLLPIFDFSSKSVDEKNPDATFNWGYDPVNYNAVEGSYSTKPDQPFNRIQELQEMIDKLHQNDLAVIMDVVYNHVSDPSEHSFEKIVPGYYFRQAEDGSYLGGTGVGNETASERKMMRKFIIDSTKYWLETYKLDGFRFDLMGTHDYETINMVYEELKNINPNVILLGEGWNMDVGLEEDKRATQLNADKMPEIAFFNDEIRDQVKGSVFEEEEIGFVQGKSGLEKEIIKSIKGGQGLKTYSSSKQLIQYVEAHDNLTLWDKLKLSYSRENEESRLKRHKLATSIIMFSQGTPFIHAGQEFARTKDGDSNSYKSPDPVNQFDWSRVEDFSSNIDYVRELIKIRRHYNLFDMNDFEKINKNFKELQADSGTIAYQLSENGEDLIIVAHNANSSSVKVPISNGNYKILVKDQKAKFEGISNVEIGSKELEVDPLSTMVLVGKKNDNINNNKEKANDKKPIEKPSESTQDDEISRELPIYVIGGSLLIAGLYYIIKRLTK